MWAGPLGHISIVRFIGAWQRPIELTGVCFRSPQKPRAHCQNQLMVCRQTHVLFYFHSGREESALIKNYLAISMSIPHPM
jgi:hypothetical protein